MLCVIKFFFKGIIIFTSERYSVTYLCVYAVCIYVWMQVYVCMYLYYIYSASRMNFSCCGNFFFFFAHVLMGRNGDTIFLTSLRLILW